MGTASVAQSVERWSKDPGVTTNPGIWFGSRVQFPAGGLGVAFFATGLKMYIFVTLEFTLLQKSICFVTCLFNNAMVFFIYLATFQQD